MKTMIVIGGYAPIRIDRIFLALGKITVTLHFTDIRATNNALKNIREALENYESIMFVGDVNCKVHEPFYSVASDTLNCDICFHFYLEDLEPI